MKESLPQVKTFLLTGVSFTIIFIACIGIPIVLASPFAPMSPQGPDFSSSPVPKLILDIGAAAFALMLPIPIVPIVFSCIVGVPMLKAIGVPILESMAFLGVWLKTMWQGNAVLLALVLGATIAFDMGGPENKAAFFFGSVMDPGNRLVPRFVQSPWLEPTPSPSR